MTVTWLLAPVTGSGNILNILKLSCFWVEVNIECGIGGGDDC